MLREKHKLDLEIFKLENELGLSPSKFTKQFYGITYQVVTNVSEQKNSEDIEK